MEYMKVSEAAENYNMRILVILRGDLTVVPMDELKMRQNDILIVKSEKLVKD